MGCVQTSTHDDNDDNDSDTDSITNHISTPFPPIAIDIPLQSKSPTEITVDSPPIMSTIHMTSLSYRTKRVLVYKPQIQKLKTQTHRIKRKSIINIHRPEKSKDDLNLYFDTKKQTALDNYDTECVTDIDDIDDVDTDIDCNDNDNGLDIDDNQTVIHHTSNNNSLLNYDSDTLTYHAYGGGKNNDGSNENININHTNTNTMITHHVSIVTDLYDCNDSSNTTEMDDDDDEDEDDDDETSIDTEPCHDEYNQSTQINKSMILKKILMNAQNIQKMDTDKLEVVQNIKPGNSDDIVSVPVPAVTVPVAVNNNKVLVVEDMNKIIKILNNISKENCLEKLELLGIITYIFVEINEFDRWNSRNIINNIINLGDNNYEKYKLNPNKYIKMVNFRLCNSKLLIKLGENEKELFKILILFGLEQCKNIYKINFNNANITNSFLDRILLILENRNKLNEYYGPELLFIENNPINDRGIQMICKYIQLNGKHLKHIAVGHCFANISANLCLEFCQSLKYNKSILKITFDLKNIKHRQSVDKSLKNNYAIYTEKQKQSNKIVE